MKDIRIFLTVVLSFFLIMSCGTHPDAYFVVTVTPQEAAVYIDGQLYEPDSEGTVSAYLTSGIHKYTVSASGYDSFSGRIRMKGEKEILNVKLVSNSFGSLRVQTVPSGSQIYFDGELLGTSPDVFKVPVGVHNLNISHDGYKPKDENITITVDSDTLITCELERQMTQAEIEMRLLVMEAEEEMRITEEEQIKEEMVRP